MVEKPICMPVKTWNVSGHGLRVMAFSYLALLVVIPLASVVYDGFQDGILAFFGHILTPSARSAIKITLWTSSLMALINGFVGTVTAYVLVRYRFWGKSLLNALVDLPFAIPSLVIGVMLAILYGPEGIFGGFFLNQWDWHILFEPPAIVLALLFINYPIVIRSVQPVLQEIQVAEEEVAATLGASSWRVFWRIIFPHIRPALLSGMLLSFARALGEFGSIVIVAGNLPMHSQVASVYVWGEIESENRLGASAMSVVLLLLSFSLVLIVDWLQNRKRKKHA